MVLPPASAERLQVGRMVAEHRQPSLGAGTRPARPVCFYGPTR